jgi:hypothetical protein
MSWGRLVGFVAIALLAGVACEDDAATPESTAGAPGAAGAPDAGDAGAGGSSAGGSNAGSSSAGNPGAGGCADACTGDATLWASLTAAPPACETAEDCCVVVNSCLAQAQIVHADDFDAAQTAWPSCDADCVDCVPPVVRVACDNGLCIGTSDPESPGDGVSHCGYTASMTGSPGQSFSCDDH